MRKLSLFILLLFGLINVSVAQEYQQKSNSAYQNIKSKAQAATKTHIDRNGDTYNWKLSSKSCYGCGSFYYSIQRSLIKNEEGYYVFYLYFWSNSFYANGYVASTYIDEIKIYAIDEQGNEKLLMDPFYLLAKPKNEDFNGYNLGAVLYSPERYQIFKVTWGQSNAY